MPFHHGPAAGPLSCRALQEADLEPGWVPGQVVSGGVLGATPLARFPVSPLILCPQGLGRGVRLMLRTGCWDRASCLVPSGALRLHPRRQFWPVPGPRWQRENEAQRRLVWALKSQGPVEGGAGDTSREGL